ncbi:MAG TPA: hypothetical protein VEC08_05800 [Nitrososphaerales archaeon]|nr:hypothetical protein [Nitrososphaerales archaeon]HYB76451.1 hypothetical protein [Nitrososphaerales archaeon]
MRISTAATLRAIDKWKEKTRSEASRFYLSTWALFASVLPPARRGRILLAVALIVATMANFAFSELALLVFLGFLTAKLQCYRLVNSFLRFMPSTR